MKKIIVITLLLLIGLMVLGGCTHVSVEPSPSTNQRQNQQNTDAEQQQNQQEAINGESPQPPALPRD